jgi:hypothetical protein
VPWLRPLAACGGQTGNGTGFSQTTVVFPRRYHSTNSRYLSSSKCWSCKNTREGGGEVRLRTVQKAKIFRKSVSAGWKSTFHFRLEKRLTNKDVTLPLSVSSRLRPLNQSLAPFFSLQTALVALACFFGGGGGAKVIFIWPYSRISHKRNIQNEVILNTV